MSTTTTVTTTTPSLLTPREAAAFARVGMTTLYGALRRGELRHVRIPPGRRAMRIELADLQAWLNNHTQGGGAQ